MNFAHAANAAPPDYTRSSRLGNTARDLLSIVWASSGITTGEAGVVYGDRNTAQRALHNLAALGYLRGELLGHDMHRSTRWQVADVEAARLALSMPPRVGGDKRPQPERRIPTPDLDVPPAPMPTLTTAEMLALVRWKDKPPAKGEPAPARHEGPVVRARQESPPAEVWVSSRAPVVRAGSLDALRLRSLRCPYDRGQPETRLGVVEAGGAA